jgi:predicted NAD-dependent protein-ADP-ribosyltransferase YbiA (DUF1768 family)
MAAGPIYEFRDNMSWASNFFDGHLIALRIGAENGFLSNVTWLQGDMDAVKDMAALYNVRVVGNTLIVNGNERPFQAFKTSKLEVALQVLAADSAGASKKLGKPSAKGGIVDDLQPDWDRGFAQWGMAWLLCQKFMDATLRENLVKTGYRMLVEGNTWGDVRWGAIWVTKPPGGWARRPPGKCWGRRDKEDGGVEELWGENWLGRLLMHRRASIDCGPAVADLS